MKMKKKQLYSPYIPTDKLACDICQKYVNYRELKMSNNNQLCCETCYERGIENEQ